MTETSKWARAETDQTIRAWLDKLVDTYVKSVLDGTDPANLVHYAGPREVLYWAYTLYKPKWDDLSEAEQGEYFDATRTITSPPARKKAARGLFYLVTLIHEKHFNQPNV